MQELFSLPPLFASVTGPTKSSVKLSICLSDDVRALVVSAVSVENNLYSANFDETELGKVKDKADKGMNWKTFRTGLQTALSTGSDVSLNVDGTNMLVSVPIGSTPVVFPLPKTASTGESNGTLNLLDRLYNFYQIRTDKNPDAQLGELTKKEERIKKQVTDLEQERDAKKEAIAKYSAEENDHMTAYSKLTEELNELTEKERKAREAAGEDPDVMDDGPAEPDFSAGLCRIPLGTENARVYDAKLLQLIKSKFTPKDADDSEDSSSHCKLIKPLTTNDFESQCKNLTGQEAQIVMNMMKRIDDWDMNVFTVQDVTQRGSLFHIGYALLLRYDFLRKYKMDEEVVINFLSQIEAGYHPNPYHNSTHAADVAHIVHFILSPGKLKTHAQLEDHDVFAAILAGMIHDYDHPGINNNFHVKVQSYLAVLYNDRSILENHHCAEVFELMKHPRFNLLASIEDDKRRDIRETVIDMVLSTDMGLHAKILGNWKRRISQNQDLHLRKDDQRLALSMAIKMADISNCGRPENIYLKWTNKLFEEFFLQGDTERNLGNQVSPFMDRYLPSMAKSQVAFMNYIVIPLFESIAEYLPDMHFTVDHCESNKNYWADNDDTV